VAPVDSAPPIPNECTRTAAALMNEQVVIARREKNFDISGVGCVIQGLGLLAPFAISVFLGFIGGAIGMILLVVMFFIGAAKHTKWICSNCKNPVDSEEVALCASCGAHLE
jgi:hypothetical protein